MFRTRLAAMLFVYLFALSFAGAQTPVALPYTMTTWAGTSPMSATAGTQCPGLPTGVVSTDAWGDGCLAVNGIFGAGGRGGTVVDAFGNVFVADDVDNVVHMINGSSGIMSKVAGGGTACSTSAGGVDSAGDGCLAATQTVTKGQRGIGIDPYGNVLLAGYSDKLLHVVCRTASPLCSPSQIGDMEMVAGCVASAGGSASGGVGADNVQAAEVGVGTCSASTGEVDQPRGITADAYGNVYFADTGSYRFRVVLGPKTSTYFSGDNPLWAALGVHYASLTQGYAYTVVNLGGSSPTATTQGNACSETTNGVAYNGTALDAYGDGCPLDFSSVSTASSSYVQGVAVDAAGNMIFTDPKHGLRVLFVNGAGTAGTAMAAAIAANNPGVTPQPGFVYMLAGGGTTAISTTPILGNSASPLDSTVFKVTVSPQGNIYIGDSSSANKILFFDINTGYIRTLFTSKSNVTTGSYCNGSSGQTSLSAYSDGCPVSESGFANSNNLGISVDASGNLYMYDTTGTMLVRKVLAQGLAEQTAGTPLVQSFQIHLPESATGTLTGATATLTSTPDLVAGTPACTQNADNSVDCTVTVTAMPSAAGTRSAALNLALPSGSWTNASDTIALGGTVAGSVLAVDNASTSVSGVSTPIAPTTNDIFASISPAGVAVDGAGNVYAMDVNSGSILESVQGAAGVAISTSLPSNPGQIAVDQRGDVFAVGSGTPVIEELKVTGAPPSAGAPASFTPTTLSYTPLSGTAAPQAVAVDNAGNLFVADYQASGGSAIYRLSLAGVALQYQTTVATGLSNPVSLAVDALGNVYAADKGAGAVYKFAPGADGSYTQTTLLASVEPVAVAADAAGDVYVQDESSASILEIPVSGAATVPVLTGLNAPTGLAVNGKGDVYSADAHNTAIVQVVRDAGAYDFGTDESVIYSGTLTNTGNQAVTGSNPVTNTTNFDVTGGSANGCSVTNSILGALAAGQSCTLNATLVGGGTGTVNDVLSFLPAASTVGSLTLSGTLTGTATGTTTTINGPSPTAPVYAFSGTEATFTVTVAAQSGATAPGGTVAVTVDSTTTYPSLTASGTSGIATVTISGLTAGTHTISAVYDTSGSFTGSNSGSPQSFTIGQVTTSISWTPSASSQPVSQAIGTGVLDAVATPTIAGTLTYSTSASPDCTAASAPGAIDASSYLPIGSYTLYATFCPNDSADYASSTATVSNYTVTKADTTAIAGASTMVVAADGSGNYTSLSAALAALPTAGGTIYIKPGTYTGQNAISYPNVALRGLGGDPTKVILTAEDGAFSSPFVYPNSGPGNASASGDQGSSTLDVAKSAYIGNQPTAGNKEYTPNNFYAEYLTIQNTYNTDATTTSTYSTASGSCADTGVPQTLQALYNSGKQCNSQALALWITADQAVLNNVNLTSQQDTLYAGSQGCGSTCTPARQYMWQGTITGDVDYVFGDAAMAFDHTNFFTTWHGTSATGTETIEAQNKKFETGSSNDYLSGYVCNGCTLMSQSSGMTNLYYGRPYGPYSTWIMLNSYVDQVNPAGWIEFSNDTNLPTSTYAEYNTQTYTDPTPGTAPYPATLFGGAVTPTGGNTGAGVTGTRETTSQDPGTIEAANTIKTQLTAAQAAQYYPVTFLSSTVPTQSYTGFTANWNPVTALAADINSFAATGNVTLTSPEESVTILGRPQTPGAGLIPTGTYQFLDGGTVIASGTLDASGEASFTTSTLSVGTHTITMTYSGDSNFNGSTSAPVTVTVPSNSLTSTTTTLSMTSSNITYGAAVTGSVTVTPQSGTATPTGTVTISSGTTAVGSCTLSGGSCTYSLTGLPAGVQSLSASYGGDTSFAASTASSAAISVARAILQVTANSYTIAVGGALPAYAATITGFVNGDTQASAVSGSPAITGSAADSNTAGLYPIAITTGTLAASNYNFTFTNGYLRIVPAGQAAAVATGDTRTVTEPQFPPVCQQLTAAITMVNNDIPASVDATVTNPDGARIQAALNACAGTGEAVELSMDGAGHDAFLSGPLVMPSNVTLLVDPGVVLFFSRNVQDYDKVAGVHTCGTVNSSSATSSCQPLIDIPKTSTNVGIMGYGKLDGRGGDPLINAFPASYAGQSWWGLSAIANSGGSQQNPRFIQMDGGSSNITLYKITLLNSPLFHVSTTGAVSNFTAWDVKIVTPTTARNTDGIDPGNAQNFTITRSWISDGDDNVAIGAGGTAPSENISVTNNHFFAGHGESIGSYTQAGVSNVLFDGNMLWGNANVDSNSTGIRIKSANDRGGLVTNIQYSNSCFQNHKAEIQFTPLYNTNTGTLTPDYQNILLQNLDFLTEGTVQFTGSDNPTTNTIEPLEVTLDNVNFTTLQTSDFITSGSSGTETNAALTYGPGDVSSNFIDGWATFAGSNGDTATNNITATSLYPPQCNFTAIAPELTGPAGLPQTITYGENATAVVILTPAVGGAPYPTGTVTLTDALTGNTTTVTLPGNTDTVFIPLSGLSVGTHTFSAAYSGDANYVAPSGSPYTTAGPYVVTVNAGSLASTTTALSGVPSTVTYGTAITASATVSGSNPTGTVEFVVNNTVYASSALASGTASTTLNLPYSTTPYSIVAIYSGDNENAGSTSSAAQVTVEPALTATALSANNTTTSLGHPLTFSATVTSSAGTPVGSVVFSYTTATNSTPATLSTSPLVNGIATATANLPVGADSVSAAYAGNGSFGSSTSTPLAITVNLPAIIPLPQSPLALPYTMTTLAGGAAANCATATDKYGNGCPATSVTFSTSDDLRSVDADPFGNVYLTDASASEVRRIAPSGIITDFAGYVSGTTCVPNATTTCIPTEVKLNKPRGISVDAQGNVYIAGYSDNKVYEVSAATGMLSLVAGTGTRGTPTASNGDGGPATSATLYGPRGVWADALGNVYIADTSDNTIREVDTTGTIQTIAGTGVATSTGDGGPAIAATIDNPQGVLTDANLNVYVADSHAVRVICVTCGTNSPLDNLLAKLGITSPVNGDIYTIAGGQTATYAGTYPTLATNISMSPQKLGIGPDGNLYISDGNGVIWFLDSQTGYIRPIAGMSTTNCSTATDNYGDGCPATQAIIGDAGNGIGVGTDSLGNLYISDTLNQRIRKVTTDLASPATATGTTTTQPVELHFIPGDNLASNGLTYTAGEWSLTTPACTTNPDSTADCLLSSSFTPVLPGARSTPLLVSSSAGNTATVALTGVGLGAGATVDPASRSTFGSNLAVAGLATDNAGNVYVSDANSKQLLRFTPAAMAQGAGATGTALATLTAPGAIAVDPRGFTYVADTSAGTVTQISPTGAVTTLPFTFTTPAGLAVDALNNLYVSDSAAQAVYQINPITGVEHKLALGPLVSPAGLAIDPAGNLLVADPGAPAIYRFNLGTNTRTTVSTSAVAPSAVVTDAAGNLLVADSASILAVPASANSASFTVASIPPAALAIDAAGNLYTGSSGSVLKLTRTQGYAQFPATSASPQTIDLLESGNQVFNATSFAQTDTSDYSLTTAASTDCTINNSGAGTLAVGGVCDLTATYTPTTYSLTTDTVAFDGNLVNAALSTPSAVQLVLTGPVSTPAAGIVLGAFSPASPVYGQTVTLSAAISGGSVLPAGSVVFTVDSTTYSAAVSSGVATVTVSGLSVGSHTVFATYTSSDGYTSATSATATLTVAQATPTVTAWPTASAITAGQTLASSQLSGGAASVSGSFAFTSPATAPGPGTAAQGVTFTPTDTVDYSTVTGTVSVTVDYLPPVISALSPPLNVAGNAAFTFNVQGSGFASASTIYWGTTALATQYVSSSQLAAQVPASDIAAAGTAAITVQTPSPGGGISNAMQFEIDSSAAGDPTFATVTATVAPGSTATYPVTLPHSATNAAATCLNLPAGASCVYSATAGTVTITTSPTTPAGTYQVTVVFSESLPASSSAMLLLPIFLLPLALRRKKLAAGGLLLTICLCAVLAAGLVTMGCGGSSHATQPVTSSGVVSLTVK